MSITSRRLAILCEGTLDFHHGKTAVSLLRYRPRDIAAVIDSSNVGRTAQDVLGVGGKIPIVPSVQAALQKGSNTLLIGVAPRGGGLPPEWREQIIFAISNGMEVISGLHYMLNDDEEFASMAAKHAVALRDVRRPPDMLAVAELKRRRPGSHVVTFVGSDCAVGKMTAALEITAAARMDGLSVSFVATGQTGIMLEGSGIAIDRVIGDFMSGAAEKLVTAAAETSDWVFVEGQGSLFHPAYSGVTLALLHGSSPDALILVDLVDHRKIDDYDISIPPIEELVHTYEEAASWVKPAPVVGIALNTRSLDDSDSRDAIREVESRTGIPTTDPVKFDAGKLVTAVVDALAGKPAGAAVD